MRLSRSLVLLVVALMAAPAFAYTIYLKDGSRLVAKEKYVIQGDKAIIILPSGSQSMIDAAEIDVERTEGANKSRLSATATVIEGGQQKELKETAPPPKKTTLQDMIKSNEAGMRAAPQRAEPSAMPRSGSGANARRERAPQRAPFPDTGTATDILSFAAARDVAGLAIYRGTLPKQPLLAFETGSEGSVFKALVVSANALIHIQNVRPGEVDSFELICETPNGGPGGRFILTPQLAADLVSGRYEITRFFVENVVF